MRRTSSTLTINASAPDTGAVYLTAVLCCEHAEITAAVHHTMTATRLAPAMAASLTARRPTRPARGSTALRRVGAPTRRVDAMVNILRAP
ncbi:hypothetical protein MSHI_24230 [Mycobacterium shinjukuense]|uniref:Uncharacterized protein n=1 Tax=Mycobacterium shinjukuense TaxID=398694 RepID=A0A7I7MRR4_9MYCO|nr:hypothetical protein MSHI_24230 [Mycobacterium shinjukuense]